MKPLFIVGLLVLILGLASFFIPFPSQEHHGVKVGGADIGVTTEHDQHVSPAISVVLLVAGAGLMIAGRR
ncbi:MAG: hypothetical protein H0X25_20260 [Acidobacteriales bacterium]|nr:hypothetical protein [Terriglobales bacterium]